MYWLHIVCESLQLNMEKYWNFQYINKQIYRLLKVLRRNGDEERDEAEKNSLNIYLIECSLLTSTWHHVEHAAKYRQ